MHILVTNDDGVTAPGLLALANAMKPYGKVSVLAPDRNWSASGHVKTLERPLRVRETHLADGTPAWCTDGAPSDCVALASLGVFAEKIDLVVSGINPNANIGHDVTYSGTVTAAMEAAISGIHGLAFSLDRPEDLHNNVDYETTARVAGKVVEMIESHNLPVDTILNVNVPYLAWEELKGFRITRQGLRIYRDELVRRQDPRGRPYYWIGGDSPTGRREEGTDYGMLKEGYVSITPIQLDLTAHQMLATIEGWGWEFDPAK
jgi:5'-nucleotidase